MRCEVTVAGERFDVALSRPTDLAIPLDFSGPQPEAFGLGPAESAPYVAGDFVGEVARGGAVNCHRVTLWPHGNGTHTESVGHITAPPPPVGLALGRALLPATLLSVGLTPLKESQDTYPDGGQPGDLVVTCDALRAALSRHERPRAWREALILRTLPNDLGKRAASYSGQNPAYLSAEAMAWVRRQGARHLLVDLPSVDREEDGGALRNHRAFWEMPLASSDPADCPDPGRTITELIYVPQDVSDGVHMLSLQVPAFLLDAAPSRPLIYPVKERRPR